MVNDPSAVRISGAVSPAPRATASIDPVASPGAAAGRTTLVVVCHRRAPSPSAALRRLSGPA